MEITADKFNTIYNDEAFRNAVAMPVKCCTASGEFKHFETVTYPKRYVVTEAHIEEAKIEKECSRMETIEANKGKLLFVGMGSTYEARYDGDPCNHRIRTELLNSEGKKYFIEVGTGRGDEMRIDHAIDRA